MSLGNMVPGSEIDPDWRAVVAGGAVLGVLCLLPTLGGWVEMPTAAAASPTAVTGTTSNEGPGILETGLPFLVGAPGAFLAGYLARRKNLVGALEGMLSVPVGAPIPVVAAMIDRFLLFSGIGVGWQIEMVWRGVGAWAVIAVPFLPLACMLGGGLGWLGMLANDAVHGGITVS
ncbi:hypothetical protein [Halolamina salifodinae]|uniref:Uncharacterized protein n=1 Tax=Halolamina salifodinae TaxID=1202767 RepID=A0A8T4GRD2_9EURY|nr:hypothetical protein [Halolamina salifodinae]MBP1985701.1 hypothetical protein [Halolamina salifodinae]